MTAQLVWMLRTRLPEPEGDFMAEDH